MHDYMKELYHRFENPSERVEELEEAVDKAHKQLANRLKKPERKNAPASRGYGGCAAGSILPRQFHVRLQSGPRHPPGTAGRSAAL